MIGISLAFIINFGPQAGGLRAADRPAATADDRRSAQASTIVLPATLRARRSQRKGFDEAKAKAEGSQRIAESLSTSV